MHAIESRTLPLHDLTHRCMTDTAWFAGTAIHKITLLEITRLPVDRNEILERAAALLYRSGQYIAYRLRQPLITLQTDAMCRRTRIDARAKQTFRSIDIADTDHDIARQQHLLDGSATTACMTIQPATIKSVFQRLHAQCA